MSLQQRIVARRGTRRWRGNLLMLIALGAAAGASLFSPAQAQEQEQAQDESLGAEDAQAAAGESGPQAELEEIVVYGRRRDARMAIQAKRDADQILDVLTSDQTSRLPDNNVAESLGRIAGVSFRRSGETGSGDYIAVRGLDSALNSVSFDGVKSGLAGFSGRRVPLDGITTEDVSELRVVKSLLPRDAGEGIGGAVDVVSRRPLDYDSSGVRATAEGRYGEFAEKWGHRGRLSFNTLFGERLGTRFSASFRQRNIRNFEMDATSSNLLYLPPIADAAGNPVDNRFVLDRLDDPGSSFDRVRPGFFPIDAIGFEEHTYEVQDQRRETVSLSGAIEWQATASTSLLLNARYNRQDTRAVENSIAFDNDDDDFELVGDTLRTVFDDPEIDLESQIEDQESVNASAYLGGTTGLGRLTLQYRLSYSNAKSDEPETNIHFDTGSLLDEDAVRFVPFSFTGTYFPVPRMSAAADPDFQEALANFPGTQLLDDFTMDSVNERSNDRLGFKFDADYLADWSFAGGRISAVSAGVAFERSEFEENRVTLVYFEPDALNLDGTFNPDFEGSAEGERLENFEGLFGGFVSLDPLGSPLKPIGLNGIPRINERAFRRLAATFRHSFLASGEAPNELFFLNVDENLLSGYAQAEFEAGKLFVAGGARIESYRGKFAAPLEINADLVTVNLADPADPDSEEIEEVIDLRAGNLGGTVRSEADNLEVLPRLNLKYELRGDLQLRAGAGYSIARPSFYQLGRASSISLVLAAEADRAGDTPVLPGVATAEAAAAAGLSPQQLSEVSLFVSSGNPNLDNAKSLNLDLSLEYFPMPGTALTLGLFHKEIENFIFVESESGTGGLDTGLLTGLLSPAARTLVEQLGGIEALAESDAIDDFAIRQPRNGEKATVQGAELAFSHQFTWARGWLSNLGLSVNAAYTRSRAEIAAVEAATPSNPDAGLQDWEALVELGFANEGDGVVRRTAFYNAPTWSANAAVYYEGGNFECALSMQHQSSSFDSLDDFGFDQYSGRYTQWDLYLEYEFPARAGLGETSVYLEVPDITDTGRNPTDLQSLGRARRVIDEASFNGREFRIGLRGRF